MAQNECQQMPKTDFYQSLRNLLTRYYNIMQDLEESSEFLASLDATTATNMGIPSDVQTVLGHLRTAINESLDFYDGTAQTQTQVLKTRINQLKYIT